MKKMILVGLAVIAIAIVVVITLRSSKNSSNPMNQIPARTTAVVVDETGQNTQTVEHSILPYSEDNLLDATKALLGLDGVKHDYNALEAAISGLPKDIPSNDTAALRDMLNWPNDKFPSSMRPIEINAVKNDVMDRLLRQNVLPEGIGKQLVEMASNPENDPVWRDYCVQFMTPFYERYSSEKELTTEDAEVQGGNKSEESVQSVDELSAVHDAMFAALDERDGTLAGTALIGLELLSRTYNEFDREATLQKALEIASDESASSSSRLTALRMASMTSSELGEGVKDAAETARAIAQTGETVLLRSAAIVTLGEVGSDEDRELLESYLSSDNKQIAAAAKLALQKMDAPQEPAVDLSKPATVSDTTTSPQPEPKLAPVLIN